MATIEKQSAVALSQSWGVTFSDYKVNGQPVDFQDLMIVISEKRAVTVEAEVTPMTKRINKRNKDLEDLGEALADLTAQQATYASDASGSTQSSHELSDKTRETCGRLLGWGIDYKDRYLWKSYTEMFIQKCKSKIDALNNQAQTDMSRLQALVDRRDESYSTASNLMSAVSDTRSNLIRNL
ncbi:MAG: hypothetical protein IKO55_08460 [Kiritimatiellae bacterium]|nr:hypothetical protein [Kiritimatiellia bacterium]